MLEAAHAVEREAAIVLQRSRLPPYVRGPAGVKLRAGGLSTEPTLAIGNDGGVAVLEPGPQTGREAPWADRDPPRAQHRVASSQSGRFALRPASALLSGH